MKMGVAMNILALLGLLVFFAVEIYFLWSYCARAHKMHAQTRRLYVQLNVVVTLLVRLRSSHIHTFTRSIVHSLVCRVRFRSSRALAR